MSTVRSTRPGYAAEATAAPGFTHVTPEVAASTMHDDLADNANSLASGTRNVPVHPACEASDKMGFGGDAALHDPTGIGRGV